MMAWMTFRTFPQSSWVVSERTFSVESNRPSFSVELRLHALNSGCPAGAPMKMPASAHVLAMDRLANRADSATLANRSQEYMLTVCPNR